MASDMELVSDMETEAADCRRRAAKFKLKAECARVSATITLFSVLERRYLLLAQGNEREAEKLRAKPLSNPVGRGMQAPGSQVKRSGERSVRSRKRRNFD